MYYSILKMISNVKLGKTILVTIPFCLKLLEAKNTTMARLIENLPANFT
jgi:hypothetical protein